MLIDTEQIFISKIEYQQTVNMKFTSTYCLNNAKMERQMIPWNGLFVIKMLISIVDFH